MKSLITKCACQLKHDCSHSELLKIVAGCKSHYWIEKSLLVVSYLDSQEGTAVYWPKYWCGNIFINIWDMSMIFSKWQTPLVKSLCYFDIKFCDSILSKLFGNFSKLFSIPFQAQSRTYHLELKLQSFQMARLFLQHLASCKNKNLPNYIQNLSKYVRKNARLFRIRQSGAKSSSMVTLSRQNWLISSFVGVICWNDCSWACHESAYSRNNMFTKQINATGSSSSHAICLQKCDQLV